MANKRLGQPGQAGAVEQPKQYSGGPMKSSSSTRTWKGPKAVIKAMITQLSQQGYEWTYEEGPVNATITGTLPGLDLSGGGGEVPIDTWELLPGGVEKDLLYADLAVINGLSADQKDAITTAVENKTRASLTAAVFPGGQLATAQSIYDLERSGAKAIRQFAPTLRRTRQVSSRYAVQAANTYAGRILGNPMLITFEAPPDNFLISLNSSPYTNVSTRTDIALKYGWLKHPPTLQATYGSRFQISQEWEFGLWSIFMYGDLVS